MKSMMVGLIAVWLVLYIQVFGKGLLWVVS